MCCDTRLPPCGKLLTSRVGTAYRSVMDDELSAGVPNCPECFTALWPAGSDEKPYWYCPSCRLPRIVP
jgi:hypothetical protein